MWGLGRGQNMQVSAVGAHTVTLLRTNGMGYDAGVDTTSCILKVRVSYGKVKSQA